MTFLSAREDFVQTSLASLPGLLARLEYVSGLRTGEGYVHWGLARVFGEREAQQAISEVHTELYLEVVRTPIRTLRRELDQLAGSQADDVAEYARRLLERREALMPTDVAGAPPRHFSSVLRALSALAKQRAE